MNALVYVNIDQGIHKVKLKVARNEKRKKLRVFSFSINIANFEAFRWTKKLISNLFFLKSDLYYDYVKKSTNMKKYWVKTNWENLFSMNRFWLFKTLIGIILRNKIFHFATEWDTFARGDDQRDNKAGASAKTFSLSM